MESKQAKADKEEYLGIINDITLAENMATEAIGNGYVGIGEKGGTAYVQVSEAMARHLEETQKGITFLGNMTDEYGNMIVKASDYDMLIREATWAETHMKAVESLKAVGVEFENVHASGTDAIVGINMATTSLIDNQDMVVKMNEAMADGFIDAGEAMDLGITRAAGMSSNEFQKLINDTNALQYGLTSMGADGVAALRAIDVNSQAASQALSSGFVSSVDMARMGISGLGEMSSDMFLDMIEYAQNAQGEMNNLRRQPTQPGRHRLLVAVEDCQAICQAQASW